MKDAACLVNSRSGCVLKLVSIHQVNNIAVPFDKIKEREKGSRDASNGEGRQQQFSSSNLRIGRYRIT